MPKYIIKEGSLTVLPAPVIRGDKAFPFHFNGYLPTNTKSAVRLLNETEFTTDELKQAVLKYGGSKGLPAKIKKVEGFAIAWLTVIFPTSDTSGDARTADCESTPEIPVPATAVSSITPSSDPKSDSNSYKTYHPPSSKGMGNVPAEPPPPPKKKSPPEISGF